MLFLQLPADAAANPPATVPILEETALAFERALLSRDRASRLSELTAAFASNRNAASWVMRAAESRLGRTINRLDEAVNWLCDRLTTELASAIKSDGSEASKSDVTWRLPALVNRLAELDERTSGFDRRLEHEKLESLKELAYGASHEINNPLANIAARAQTLLEDEADPERQRKLVAIHRQAMRAHEMISDLMLFARPPKLRRQSCDLVKLAQNVVDQMREMSDELGTALNLQSPSEPIELLVDETQLGVAISAIVKNAIEAAGDGGHVNVKVDRVSIGEAKFAEVSVADDGPGISEEVRRHMFDPFFSGREAGRGLGFGATKSWRIVTDHGGQVVVNSHGRGAEITIRLPLQVAE